MRKLFGVALCALAFSSLAVSQAHAQSIGFKLGATFSDMDADPDEGDTEQLKSFGGGGFIRFGMGGLSLQLEALALTKGSRASDDDLGADVELKLDYIEVPITAMFSLGNGPYLFAGPSFGFETGCKVDADLGDLEFSGDCDESDEDVTVSRKKLDIGVTGGLGIQFPLGPGSLLIEGRYTHGLTNLNDDSDSDTNKVRNRSYGIFAGYAIGI